MRTLLIFFVFLFATSVASSASALTKDEMTKLLAEIDERQRSLGDYKALMYMERKEKGKSDLVYQMVMYRRDEDDKFVMLFIKPKTEAGKGYLRLDKNLFMYDPTVGKWERRTERERIGGTDSRRSDFDESRLAVEFEPEYIGEEKLGKYKVHHLKLTAKKDADVPYPILEMWIDKKTGNTLKSQDFALSGKLMRTSYFPKWERVKSETKNDWVYFPKEIRIRDEVEKGNNTLIVFQGIELKAIEGNVFTKAWLESKSR